MNPKVDFCYLQTWSDRAVAGPWACLLGACEMLMSDWSWVDASVKTNGLCGAAWKKNWPSNIWLEAGQCPMNISSCLLRFCPSICQYLLIESQMTDVIIKFLHESVYMNILRIQGFFIQKRHLPFIAWGLTFCNCEKQKITPHLSPPQHCPAGHVALFLELW